MSTGRRRHRLWGHGHFGPDSLLPLDDDELTGGDPVLDDSQSRAAGPESDPALLDLVVLADDEHAGTGLVDGDGGFGDHDDLVATLLFNYHPYGLAGGEDVVRIGE